MRSLSPSHRAVLTLIPPELYTVRRLAIQPAPEGYSSTRQPTASPGDWSGLDTTQGGVQRHYHGGALATTKLPTSCPGLPCRCGYVVEDLSVAEHDPKYGATFTLPFDYDPESASRCNKWLEFLISTWGSEPDFDQRVMALQEMFAATLFGIAPAYQRAFLLFGKAATGKTQILRVLRAMLPPDATAELGPQYWGMQFHLPALIGKTANICGELPESGMIAGSMFKEVVEGAPVTDSFKGKDRFTFTPKCAHWFASNYLPASRDSSRGFTRRWLILDFNHPVAEKDQVKNLAETIVAEEREAIAAWAIGGLRRLLEQNSYTIPACHEKRSGQMRRILPAKCSNGADPMPKSCRPCGS